jgi:hypothetical protein
MLYIIYGTDREKGRAQFRVMREKLLQKSGEERVVTEGETTDGFLCMAEPSQGLFGGVTLFVFDSVLEKKAEQEVVCAHAEALTLSPNNFLIFEPAFEKDMVTELTSVATEATHYAEKKADYKPDFNIFSLGDALGKRNKKELWVLYQGAVGAGISGEEICGTLFWAVKNIALMKNAKPSDDAGMNPFVAKKSREFAKNYTEKEIVDLSRALSSIYHEAHRGGESMEIALERFILSL